MLLSVSLFYREVHRNHFSSPSQKFGIASTLSLSPTSPAHLCLCRCPPPSLPLAFTKVVLATTINPIGHGFFFVATPWMVNTAIPVDMLVGR
jgi:hypothetical protein